MVFRDSSDEVDPGTFRGSRGRTVVGGSIGGILLLIIGAYFGIDPKITSGLSQIAVENHAGSSSNDDAELKQELAQCVHDKKIIASGVTNTACRIYVAISSANTVWGNPHPDGGWSEQYAARYRALKPKTDIFRGSVSSGCGQAGANVGPFYCPVDHTAYFDRSFFEGMLRKLNADDGNLAQMYVVEHEIGHHVQNLLGYEVRDHRPGPQSDSVRMELQADCFAGFWASQADKGPNPAIEPITDEQLQQVLHTAWAIGDDTLEEKSGHIDPQQFTHGTSEQRSRWFKRGYSGNFNQCDTWHATSL